MVNEGSTQIHLRMANSTDPLAGLLLKGAYRLEERIGEGGMGVVYRATQTALNRAVAVKLIRPDRPPSPSALERFFREARLLSQLHHPNIVQVIDFGSEPGPLFFMVMEHLRGETIEAYVRTRKLVVAELILEILEQITAALATAHQSQIIHRDLKPSNVFMADTVGGASPTVKVLDFGLAKVVAAGVPDGQGGLTQEGTMMGTCGYAAPEQLNGHGATERSDLYSLAATLYYLLSGRPPYRDEGMARTLMKQLTTLPDPLTADGLTPVQIQSAEAVIRRALSPKPSERHRSLEEFVGEVRMALVGTSDTLPPSSRLTRRSRTTRVPETGLTPQPVTNGSKILPRYNDLTDNRARRRGVLWAAVVAAAVVAFGTGGWYTLRGRSDGATRTATAPGVTADEILVGLSGPFSGPNRDMGRAVQAGIETCFAEVNAAGGIHGRRLRLLPHDDGYEPALASEIARDLIEKHDVFAFLAPVGTPTTEASLPIALQNKRIMFGAISGARHLRQDPPERYVFNYRASDQEETAALIRYLVERRKIDPTRLAVFAQNDSFGDGGFQGVVRALRERGVKAEQVLRVGYDRNTTDVSAAVRTLAAAQPVVKGVLMIATARPAAQFIRQMREAGLTATLASVSFVSTGSLTDYLSEGVVQVGEGVIVSQVVPHPRSNGTGGLHFRSQLEKHSPTTKPCFLSLEAYLASRLFAEGLRKAGPHLTTESLVAALHGMNEADQAMGLAASFSPTRHQALTRVWGTILDRRGIPQPLDFD